MRRPSRGAALPCFWFRNILFGTALVKPQPLNDKVLAVVAVTVGRRRCRQRLWIAPGVMVLAWRHSESLFFKISGTAVRILPQLCFPATHECAGKAPPVFFNNALAVGGP